MVNVKLYVGFDEYFVLDGSVGYDGLPIFCGNRLNFEIVYYSKHHIQGVMKEKDNQFSCFTSIYG